MRDARIELLLAAMDEAFDGNGWHGPTLRAAIRGVTAVRATLRPGRGRHSIREIVVHAAYWKHAVRGRLQRGVEPFALAGENWFTIPGQRPWSQDVALLADEHRRLREVVSRYPPADLDRPVDRNGQTAALTIRGIAAHDVYHAGQIQLIKKLRSLTSPVLPSSPN